MGFFNNIKNRISGRKRLIPERDTQIYPRLMQVLGGQATQRRQPVYKPTP